MKSAEPIPNFENVGKTPSQTSSHNGSGTRMDQAPKASQNGSQGPRNREDVSSLYSSEAELAILGSFLGQSEEVGDLCQAFLRPEEFFLVHHQVLFSLLVEMHNNRETIGLVEVNQKIADRRLGNDLFHVAVDALTSAWLGFRIKSYLEIVKDKAVLRMVHQACLNILEQVQDPSEGVDVILQRADEMFQHVSRRHVMQGSEKQIKNASQVIDDFMTEQRAIQSGERIVRYPSGFVGFDLKFGGFPIGGYTVIAARPGEGKTGMGVNILDNNCQIGHIQPGIISLEMRSTDLIKNVIANKTKIDVREFEGYLGTEKWQDIEQAADTIKNKWNLRLQECETLNPAQLRVAIKELYKQGCRLIILDYIQLLEGNQQLKRHDQIAEVTRMIKLVCKEFGDLVFIVLAQVNREGAKAGEEVSSHHLKDAGSIEQDAEMVIFLTQKEEPRPFERTLYKVKVAKNRRGPKGSHEMWLDGPLIRFCETAKRI